LNTSFASLPPAPINNYNVPGTGIVVNVTWSTNGEDYHAPAFVVVDGGTGHTGGGESGGGDVLTVPYVDMGISGGGNWTWYVVDIASDVELTAGLESWTFGGDGSLTFPDATVQTTAYPGITTVAKTGTIPEIVGTRLVTGFTIEPTYDAGWVNSYSVSIAGFSCDINWAPAGYPSFANIVDTAGNRTVGDILTTVLASNIGGTVDMVLKVGAVSEIVVATAIDLTKTINKLTDGVYTLANGVEGQIMYLVPQNGVVPTDVSVLVANSRNIGVGTLLPFSVYDNSDSSYYGNIGGFCTLIFTDGAWQQSGGAWGIIT
jgi:hypothetical protein